MTIFYPEDHRTVAKGVLASGVGFYMTHPELGISLAGLYEYSCLKTTNLPTTMDCTFAMVDLNTTLLYMHQPLVFKYFSITVLNFLSVNIKNWRYEGQGKIAFESEDDAILFKLRWL